MTRLFFIACFAVVASILPSFSAIAAKYVIEPGHTRAEYHISHLGFSHMPGRFSDINGTIEFDPHNVTASKVSVLINALSVSMDHDVLDEKLKGEQFFNTKKYPLITFTSKEVTRVSSDRGTMTGDLTLLGVTKPVTLRIRFNKKGWNKYAGGEMVGFSAWGKIRRSDFGMKAYLPDVGDEVSIRIEVEAMHEKPLERPEAAKVQEIKIK